MRCSIVVVTMRNAGSQKFRTTNFRPICCGSASKTPCCECGWPSDATVAACRAETTVSSMEARMSAGQCSMCAIYVALKRRCKYTVIVRDTSVFIAAGPPVEGALASHLHEAEADLRHQQQTLEYRRRYIALRPGELRA